MPLMKLRVRPVGAALVTDFDAQENGIRRFVGRQFDPAVGFVPVDGDVEVKMRAEYVLAVKDGDLEAADAETAMYCGVPFKKSQKS